MTSKIQLGLRVPPEVAERFRNLAWATGLSVNELIEDIAIKELERREAKYEKQNGQPVPQRPQPKR